MVVVFGIRGGRIRQDELAVPAQQKGDMFPKCLVEFRKNVTFRVGHSTVRNTSGHFMALGPAFGLHGRCSFWLGFCLGRVRLVTHADGSGTVSRKYFTKGLF